MSTPEHLIGFRARFDEVCLRQIGERNWVTLTQLHYRARTQTFVVPAHAETDLASVPRPVAALVPSYGKYTACAILHDHLWRIEVPAGNLGYRDADAILRQAMRAADVPLITRWVMWAAVRWGALCTRDTGSVGWLADAPLVLLWTLLALVPVLVVAVPTVAVLGLVWLAEAVVYGILRVLPAKRPGRNKKIVPPKIGTRL